LKQEIKPWSPAWLATVRCATKGFEAFWMASGGCDGPSSYFWIACWLEDSRLECVKDIRVLIATAAQPHQRCNKNMVIKGQDISETPDQAVKSIVGRILGDMAIGVHGVIEKCGPEVVNWLSPDISKYVLAVWPRIFRTE